MHDERFSGLEGPGLSSWNRVGFGCLDKSIACATIEPAMVAMTDDTIPLFAPELRCRRMNVWERPLDCGRFAII